MKKAASFILSARDLCIGYAIKGRTERKIAGPLNLKILPGRLIYLLGSNGSGKSTLIKTLAGILPALSGTIFIDGESIEKLKLTTLATRLSLVLTDKVKTGNLNVFSLVSLGRYPYTGWLGNLNLKDMEKIESAIKAVHLENFRERNIDELSDGEHQKVMLARALAQDTPLIFLDEPTAHLDLQNRVELTRLLHKLSRELGKSILLSTHELDLALQTADEIWLLDEHGNLSTGAPEDLILNGEFQKAVDKAGNLFDIESGSFRVHPIEGPFIRLKAEGYPGFWTRRALIRSGYQVTTEPGPGLEVTVRNEGIKTEWTLKGPDDHMTFLTIESLVTRLLLYKP